MATEDKLEMGYKLPATITFVLAVVMIVQSAPLNKRAIGVSLVDKTQQFYCTSEQLKLQVQSMVKVNLAYIC